MRRRLTTAPILTLLLFVGLTAQASAIPPSFFGIVPQTPPNAHDYKLADKAKAGTVRLILSWPRIQPDSSTTDWSSFDSQVAMAAKRGVKILPFIYNSPDWIGGCASDCSTHAPSNSKALGHWKRFIGAAVDRYGPRGSFWAKNPGVPKRPIRDWQIWNEQNSTTFFKPKPDPKLYAKMLAKASKAIRSRDRKAEIILGGMFGTPGGLSGGQAIAAADYLRKLYRIKGVKGDFDGVALHPYGHSIRRVELQARLARRELSRADDSKTDLWVTEIGWASGGQPSGLNAGSKKAQANLLKQAYRTFEKHRRKWRVRLVAWYSLQDSQAAASFCFFCEKSGLLTESGKRKPAFDAFQRIARKR